MFGKTGETISVAIKRSKKGFGKNSFQFDCIQSSLVFSFCLKRMQFWTEKQILYVIYWKIQEDTYL